jgi:hypothetical protein
MSEGTRIKDLQLAAKRTVRAVAVAAAVVFVSGAAVAAHRRGDDRYDASVQTTGASPSLPVPSSVTPVEESTTTTSMSSPVPESSTSTSSTPVTTPPTSSRPVVPTTLPSVTVPTLSTTRPHPCPGAAPLVGSMGVFTVDTAGRLRRLTDLGENQLVRRLDWSRDGRWLAFGRDDGPFTVIGRDGGGVTDLAGVYGWAWTADNRLVISDHDGLAVLDPAAGAPAKRLTPPNWTGGSLAGLLADGRILVAANGFATVNLDGTAGERTDYDIGITSGTVDPTGRRVAYAKYDGPLRILDWATRTTVTLSAGGGPSGGFLAWSPDGSMLLADVDGATSAYRVDGTLVHRFGPGFFPAWAPGADAVAGGGASGRMVDLRGNELHRIGAPAQTIAWAPAAEVAFGTMGYDPQRYFLHNESAVCSLDRAGTTHRLVTLRRAALVYSLSWSPDGTTLAFAVPSNPDAPYNP